MNFEVEATLNFGLTLFHHALQLIKDRKVGDPKDNGDKIILYKVRPKFRVASTSKFIFYFKKPDFSIQTSQDSIWYYQKCVPKVLVT